VKKERILAAAATTTHSRQAQSVKPRAQTDDGYSAVAILGEIVWIVAFSAPTMAKASQKKAAAGKSESPVVD